MKVKDIIEITLVLVGKNSLLDTSMFNPQITEPLTNEQEKELGYLEKCFNLVYKEVSADYLPLMYEETITFKNGEFALNQLDNSILDIYKLYDNSYGDISYRLFPNYIKADATVANIIYSFLPENLELDDEVIFFGGKLLPQVLAYGIAREYCLINGELTEADIWEKRFKDGIQTEMRKKSQIQIKPRRWY
ncbi:MAG: hypothetical protein PHH71_00005 [Clostridia bacterium]|nr:hypothetical protein [Clostridia bacterium]MDD3231763.1 hypothetical protein [Clostridia bacterium]